MLRHSFHLNLVSFCLNLNYIAISIHVVKDFLLFQLGEITFDLLNIYLVRDGVSRGP